jgi:hypothetical protein
MSIADLPVADQLANAGGRKVRRYVNESIYRAATRRGFEPSSMRRFMCECGYLDCPELVALRLGDFDDRSRPGSILAHHEGPYPDPVPPDDPKPPDPDPDPHPPV